MSELNKLAHKLALKDAIEVLTSSTVFVKDGCLEWRDIDGDLSPGVSLGSGLKDEIRYLTLRDAILWHTTKPNLLRFKQPIQIGGAA